MYSKKLENNARASKPKATKIYGMIDFPSFMAESASLASRTTLALSALYMYLVKNP
jgi:hypothetical protein